MHPFAPIFAAIVIAATPAFAGGVKDPIKVRFDRSALSTEAGAETVYRAMRAKAANQCDPRGEKVRSAIEACAEDLVSQWVEAAGDSRLTAIHQQS